MPEAMPEALPQQFQIYLQNDDVEYGPELPPDFKPQQKTFECSYPGCDKTFLRKVRLVSHMHMHFGT